MNLLMFDFDGVIADSLDWFNINFHNSCVELGYNLFEDKETFIRLLDNNLFEAMISSGVNQKDITPIFDNLHKKLKRERHLINLFDGIVDMLNSLAKEFPVYIITSNISDVVSSILDKNGVKGIRDVIGSDKNPSKVEKMKSKIAEYPNHIPYYTGDTKGDIIEARIANSKTVGVDWGWHGTQSLSEENPDYIAMNIPELQKILSQN